MRPLTRALATVAVGELVATVQAAAWPIEAMRAAPIGDGPGAHRPVVLVHGFLGHPGMFLPLERRLRAEGFSRIVRVGYPSTRLTLEAICDRIGAVVKREAADGPVDLIGHSLGAVACRVWIKRMGGAPHVRRFISLGGPHAGTSLFRLVPPWLRPALSPRGPWVAACAEGAEPVQTTVIRAAYDHQVFPPERARIPGAEEVVLSRYGHNGILLAAETHAVIVNVLTRP